MSHFLRLFPTIMVQVLWNIFKKKNFFFISACNKWITQTICCSGFSFRVKSKNSWVTKLGIHQPPGFEITHPDMKQNWKNQSDLVWKKKNSWCPVNQVSTHFAFVLLDEDAWIKRGLGNVKELTGRSNRHRQSVYHTKKHTSGVSAATLSPESLTSPLLP